MIKKRLWKSFKFALGCMGFALGFMLFIGLLSVAAGAIEALVGTGLAFLFMLVFMFLLLCALSYWDPFKIHRDV